MPAIGALPDPTAYLFEVAGHYAGGTVATIIGLLFVTSIFAAVSAFHNYIARYTYVMGREGLLASSTGVTHGQHQSPHVGSIVQTVCAVVVLGLFAVMGLDPILNLFTWIGTLGIIAMMALTSLAVMVFFNRDARSENAFATKIAPLVAGVIMLGLFGYIFFNYGGLTGTSGALGYILPGLVLLAAVVGYGLPVGLKSSNPTKFVRMGENKN